MASMIWQRTTAAPNLARYTSAENPGHDHQGVNSLAHSKSLLKQTGNSVLNPLQRISALSLRLLVLVLGSEANIKDHSQNLQ